MVGYKCFNCRKEVQDTFVRKKIRCPYCGFKIITKPRNITTHVKAR